jgi:hypothetical protein
MHRTLRLTFSKTTMAAVGIAFLVPHWPTPAEGARISRDCATPGHRQPEFDIGDWETAGSSAPGGASKVRDRVEPIADGCAVREPDAQTEGSIGDRVVSYDPVRKLWQ